MEIIDSHSHLFLEEFAEDLPQVMERARQAGITHIFMPNIDSSTIESLWKVCTQYPQFCYPMAGLHPTSVDAHYKKELEIVERELQGGKPYVAIGEIGMDLYWDKTYQQEQMLALDWQLQQALRYHLPVVIHCREAFAELFQVLQPYKNTSLKGVLHSFTGTADEAEKILEFSNFLIGINGVVTFKKSTLPQVLQNVPLERLLLETDSPYLTPAPHRGKRNESAYVAYTLLKVAEVYGETPEKVAELTSKSALRLFGFSK